MKNRFAALLAAAAMLTALGGCSENGNDSDSTSDGTTTTPERVAITQIAFQADDTTEESLDFLKENSPLFYKYLMIRRGVPLTREAVITREDGDWISRTYIKDAHNAVISSVAPDGAETRVVYSVDKAYEIRDAEKKVYELELDIAAIDTMVSAISPDVSIDEVSSAQYSADVRTYDGVEYNCETVTASGKEETYYFDKNTDALCYIISGDNVMKVTRFENVFDNDAAFNIPSDYEVHSASELSDSDE